MNRPGMNLGFASFLFSLVSLGFFILSIYVLYLSIKFLKNGSEAFQVYIDNNKDFSKKNRDLNNLD